MDNLTKEQRKRNMQNIKSKDTEIEVLLRKRDIVSEKTIRNFLENQILHLRNIKLRFSVMENFFMEKIGKYSSQNWKRVIIVNTG